MMRSENMSWNEPGSPKKDPWSGRDQQPSPPDLEEVLRSIQERVGRLFGGSRGGGGGGWGGSPLKSIGWLVLASVVLWALTGIYIVQEGSRGVVTRFGRYVETTMPGPHWRIPSPVESVTVVNVEQQRIVEVGTRAGSRTSQDMASGEALMLTQDENIVDVHLPCNIRSRTPRTTCFAFSHPTPP
jgi:membrane protease subunit HflK